MKRFLSLLLAVICLWPLAPARAQGQWMDVIPTPAGGERELSLAEMQALLAATPTPAPTHQGPQSFTLLLIGTDSYKPEKRGRSDTMVLVRLDAARQRVQMVSFMRDLYVKIPGHGATRLNAAYAYGGAELLKETLYNNFGVTCDAYVAVNFSRMAELIDQLGGVTVEVSKAEMRQVNSILKYYNRQMGVSASDGLLQAYGTVALTGKQAMCFSRIRKIDSDFQRTARQRQVLQAIFEKLCTLDLLSLTRLALENLGRVTTDVTAEQAAQLVPLALSARGARFETLRIPADNAYASQTIRGMAVLVPNLKKSAALLADFFEGE